MFVLLPKRAVVITPRGEGSAVPTPLLTGEAEQVEPTPLRVRSLLCFSLRCRSLGPRLCSHLQLQQQRWELQRGDGAVRLRRWLRGRPLRKE